jgi:hypothetical protein
MWESRRFGDSVDTEYELALSWDTNDRAWIVRISDYTIDHTISNNIYSFFVCLFVCFKPDATEHHFVADKFGKEASSEDIHQTGDRLFDFRRIMWSMLVNDVFRILIDTERSRVTRQFV